MTLWSEHRNNSAKVHQYALRSLGPLPAVARVSGAELPFEHQQGDWAVNGNPLFEATAGRASATAGSGVGGSVQFTSGDCRVSHLTPRRLDFGPEPSADVAADGATAAGGTRDAGSMSAVFSMQGSFMDALAGNPSGGGGQYGLSGALARELVHWWHGNQGIDFLTFKGRMETDLAELRGKDRNALAQLDRIKSRIAPMTPGMQAHEDVVRLLVGAVECGLRGEVVAVEPLMVPSLEYLLGGQVWGAAPLSASTASAAGTTTAEDALLALQVGMLWQAFERDGVAQGASSPKGGVPDPSKGSEREEALLQDLLQLGGQQQLLVAARKLPGAEQLVDMLAHLVRKLSPTTAGGDAHGWRHVVGQGDTAQYVHEQWGLCKVADMPVLLYWVIMTRYFGVISVVEVMAIKSMGLRPGEDLVGFATHLTAKAQAVREAHRVNPASADMPEPEVLGVFSKAAESSSVYGLVYRQLLPNVNTWSPQARTALAVARYVQGAWQTEQTSRIEHAKLLAIQGIGQAQAGQQRQQPGGGVLLQHAGQRQVSQAVTQMSGRLKENLLRSLLQERGASLQPLVQGEVVAAAAGRAGQVAAGAHGGLGQHRMLQGPVGGGRPGLHPCTCADRRHHERADCWVANPGRARDWWRPPLPGDPNYQAYVKGCARDGVPVGGVAEGHAPAFPAALCVGPEVARCVPEQPGWVPHQRPRASGTQELCGRQHFTGSAAEHPGHNPGRTFAVGGGAPVVAAATRASSSSVARPEPGVAQRCVEAQVVMTLGRDMDMVHTLLARTQEEGCAAPGLQAAAAAGMFSFGGDAARKAELRQASDWAEGKVTALITLLYPRDKDLLEQLQARNALVHCALREVEPPLVAAAAASPLADVVARLPPPLREQYVCWQGREGGLVYFANTSRAEGAALVTPDGRVFLSLRFLVDNACQQGLMAKPFGLAMGLPIVQVPPMQLRMASGEVFSVDSQFQGVSVVLAMGTEHEARCVLDFWVIPGLESLADAILPTVADHQFGGAGVDRVLQQYRYRPGYASGACLKVAELPVICHQPPDGRLAAAVGVMEPPGQGTAGEEAAVEAAGSPERGTAGAGAAAEAAEPPGLGTAGAGASVAGEPAALSRSGQEASAAGPGLAGTGHVVQAPEEGRFLDGRVVFTPWEWQQLQQPGARPSELLQLGQPHESFQPGAGEEISWLDHRLWRRLQWAQYHWASMELMRGGPLLQYWECLGTHGSAQAFCSPPCELPYDQFTSQPRPAAEDLVPVAPRQGWFGVRFSMLHKLERVDGYGQRAGVWDGMSSAPHTFSVAGSFDLPWPTKVLRPDVRDFINHWVTRWGALDDWDPGAGSSSSSSGEYVREGDHPGCGSRWTHRWHLLHALWEVFEAPQPEAAAAAAEVGLRPSPNIMRADHVKHLVGMATAGLQVLQLAARLRPTREPEWDLAALRAVREMRNGLADSITEWGEVWRRMWEFECDEQRPAQPTEDFFATPRMQHEREPPVRPHTGRVGAPRVTVMRRLMLLLLALLLVVSCVAGAGALPVQQPCGGTFRCQPG